MNSFKKYSKRLLKNQKGQGMVEYVLLLVIVVGLIMLFKGQIRDTVSTKIEDLKGMISGVSGE